MADATLYDGVRFVDDAWRYLADGEDVPAEGHVILTGSQWAALAGASAPRPLGLVVDPARSLEELGDPNRFALLALPFPKFSDGRSYSLGHRLRARFGFTGELRAIGDVLFDQLQLMARCGFDTYEIRDPVTRALLDEGRRPDMSRFYQPGFGAEGLAGTRPWARRQA